ncbi:MAG: hypothetical protein KJO69_05930 [Gammaproteobacteria bacterium]|nr:hypothetical protein [Gammaproteobacteria bacterium]
MHRDREEHAMESGQDSSKDGQSYLLMYTGSTASMNISDEDLTRLDAVAAIVAGLLEMEESQKKIGESPDENRQALLVLGEEYMFLYNKVLENMSFSDE